MSFWEVANDEKFWLEGDDSDDEIDEEEFGDEFARGPNVLQKTKKYDSQEEEEHDLTRQRQNKKWEKKWERKFQSLYHNLPHRGVSARPENFTDAILACPGCFTTICEMCQQHRSMFNRWRALEVSNSCKVLKDQPQIDEDGSTYFPVVCGHCDANLGAYDEENVYHFFGVFPTSPS